MVKELWIMIAAIVFSMVVIILFAKPISDYIQNRPTMKMLALAFLLMIGLMLMIEAFGIHVPKGYMYSAMAFSITVEVLNMKLRSKHQPVKLRTPTLKGQENKVS